MSGCAFLNSSTTFRLLGSISTSTPLSFIFFFHIIFSTDCRSSGSSKSDILSSTGTHLRQLIFGSSGSTRGHHVLPCSLGTWMLIFPSKMLQKHSSDLSGSYTSPSIIQGSPLNPILRCRGVHSTMASLLSLPFGIGTSSHSSSIDWPHFAGYPPTTAPPLISLGMSLFSSSSSYSSSATFFALWLFLSTFGMWLGFSIAVSLTPLCAAILSCSSSCFAARISFSSCLMSFCKELIVTLMLLILSRLSSTSISRSLRLSFVSSSFFSASSSYSSTNPPPRSPKPALLLHLANPFRRPNVACGDDLLSLPHAALLRFGSPTPESAKDGDE
mmetsp:Transcript_30126/g.52952  ORF Transcript_30126/g.52952 Transcript_30126/m.52952 type:complete len:329 (+) Transcript_30126:455-1441(+)